MSVENTPESREASAYFDAIERELSIARAIAQPARITWLLLVANVAFFIAAWLHGQVVLHDGFGFSTRYLSVVQLSFYTGMKVTEHVAMGDWWRLLTSAFVHMDVSHIIFNAYGLYALGPLIEKFYGQHRWLVIYVGSALCASLASYFLNDAVSGGASGAIYGLVGAAFVFGFKYRAVLPERLSRALTTGMLPWVIFGIGVGFFDFLPMDNAAHIGGLISGGLIAGLMRSHLDASSEGASRSALLKLGAGICAGLVGASLVAWGLEVRECTTSADAYIACYPELYQELRSMPRP